ncbi:MAG: baseplate J/gp47 family protein [Promethearchaeota archaeon]|nr:MAG: baseplate protein J [Helarchaeota virus Nidhogg Meg22_1012]URC17417.1 MAG: baseplate protein J [Helarchaeota virus Nidhogg Meg22_1214]
MTDYGISDDGFLIKSYDVILAEMIARAQEYFGENVDLRPTSSLYKFIQVVAYEISTQWEAMEAYWSSSFLKTATGSPLDYLCSDLGIEREQPAAATGFVTFTLSSGAPTTEVPVGSTVRTSNYIYFSTDIEVNISSGSATVPVTAVETGSNGNVAEGSINVIDPEITNIESVINNSATTGGLDLETDVSLRRRGLNIRRFNYTASKILADVEEVSGIRQAKIIENYPTEYQFTLYVAPDVAGSLSSGSEYYSQALYDSIEDAVNNARPVCSEIIIDEVTPVSVEIEAEMMIKAGVDVSTITNGISDRINSYISSLEIGDTVYLSQISWCFTEDNSVIDVYSIKLNGVESNLNLSPDEIATFGSLSVTVI